MICSDLGTRVVVLSSYQNQDFEASLPFITFIRVLLASGFSNSNINSRIGMNMFICDILIMLLLLLYIK